MQPGILYVVATPIGNLADISDRAKSTLAECDLVACEDTRVTGGLLGKLGIKKTMFVNENSREKSAAPALLEKLMEGKNIALLSDAGTPCISDPGFRRMQARGNKGCAHTGRVRFYFRFMRVGASKRLFFVRGFPSSKDICPKGFF